MSASRTCLAGCESRKEALANIVVVVGKVGRRGSEKERRVIDEFNEHSSEVGAQRDDRERVTRVLSWGENGF